MTQEAIAVPPGEMRIQPIAELFTSNASALWVATYNVDLHLFSEFLFPRLGDTPLNVVVLADAERLARSLDRIPAERAESLHSVNRRWLLRGVRVDGPSFHPKTYLALYGSRALLLVGSGNLTSNGIDRGREVFTAFRSGTPSGDAALATWRAWMRRLVVRVADTTLAERFRQLETKLPDPEIGTAIESPLLHNLDTSLADQLKQRFEDQIGSPADELHVTAPFFDKNAEALRRLIEDYKPHRIFVYLTPSTKVDGRSLRNVLESSDAAIQVLFYDSEEFVHAKLVGVVSGVRSWLLSGSANLSRAAMTLTAADHGNAEMAVLAVLDKESVRRAFLPPEETASPRSLDALMSLRFDMPDEASRPELTLVRAVALDDGRVEFSTEPATPPPGMVLSDLVTTYSIGPGRSPGTMVTDGPVGGRLVLLLDAAGDPGSNRVIVDMPTDLARALRAGQGVAAGDRPPELIAGDLNTPVGRAIQWLHQNMVMDVTERTHSAPTGVATDFEAASGDDDALWERLEREQLAADPRAGTYPRMLNALASGSIGEPILDLLEAFGSRAPSESQRVTVGSSILADVIRLNPASDAPEAEEGNADEPRRWSPSARIRVRARNALLRWASAQTDPRLVWVNPIAPAGNFAAIATTFVQLRIQAVNTPELVELTETDLDDLWIRWLQPFVGSGAGGGWLDQLDDVGREAALAVLPDDLPEVVAALVWLAVRPGLDHRKRKIELQQSILAARSHGLLIPTEETARYLSAVTKMRQSLEGIEADLRAAADFIDDDLWSQRLVDELALDSLQLLPSPGAAVIQVRLDVAGIEDPMRDPRLPRLIAEVRKYRGYDGIAIYSRDGSWRLSVPGTQPAVFIPAVGEEELVTDRALLTSELDSITAGSGLLLAVFRATNAA